KLVLCDDRDGDHLFALAGGQDGDQFRHGPEKYGKFAYSTAFAFSVPSSSYTLAEQAADSTLVLSEDGVQWRGRRAPDEVQVGDGVVWSRWRPWADVEVETWLWPQLPWHVRVHRIRTERALHTAEGGWALDRTGDTVATTVGARTATAGEASASYPAGFSGLRDLAGGRAGEIG